VKGKVTIHPQLQVYKANLLSIASKLKPSLAMIRTTPVLIRAQPRPLPKLTSTTFSIYSTTARLPPITLPPRQSSPAIVQPLDLTPRQHSDAPPSPALSLDGDSYDYIGGDDKDEQINKNEKNDLSYDLDDEGDKNNSFQFSDHLEDGGKVSEPVKKVEEPKNVVEPVKPIVTSKTVEPTKPVGPTKVTEEAKPTPSPIKEDAPPPPPVIPAPQPKYKAVQDPALIQPPPKSSLHSVFTEGRTAVPPLPSQGRIFKPSTLSLPSSSQAQTLLTHYDIQTVSMPDSKH
jgi:hypothetical protein